MSADALIATLIDSAGNPVVLCAAIVLATFVLEDAATVATSMLAAEGVIPVPWALGALYAGIVLGDFGLYGLGRLAVSHPWAKRILERRRAYDMRCWLQRRLMATVFSVRFVPGLRLPVYTACGFFRLSFARFAIVAAVAVAAWTGALFWLIYEFDAWVLQDMGPWRWLAGLLLVIAIFFGPRLVAGRPAGSEVSEMQQP